MKYHLGASSDREFDGNNVHLSLTANPSHLEIVDPVVLGKARAKQDQIADQPRGDIVPLDQRARVLPLLIHGDAAFAGQGVIAECFGLSRPARPSHRRARCTSSSTTRSGFTTNPWFSYARSSPYPSDIAKMVEAPILHCNGDDPEAVVYAAKIATEFRQKFHKPVVIDMFCYRRFGHNEGDEPAFTQPLMYKKIAEHPTTATIYGDKLVEEGLLTAEGVDQMPRREWRAEARGRQFEAGASYRPNKADWLDGAWSWPAGGKVGRGSRRRAAPRRNRRRHPEAQGHRRKAGRNAAGFPSSQDHPPFPRQPGQGDRGGRRDRSGRPAEALAFGSLLMADGQLDPAVVGQDVAERGTFSQRHAVLFDQENEQRFVPLAHVKDGQGRFEIINSMLSEEAVLGFEYGYSLARPNALTLWEAQFGDFANGAQVIIDQFISSGERKWLRMSGLVLLLPHGYEGQGPEHSSARLERFLQLSAEDNMQVCNLTTPANYFHALRRQLKREFRKPLVIMTPKSLLRHKRAVSRLDEMGPDATFHRLLWDDAEALHGEKIKLVRDEKIRRVVLCSGKVYYDLYEEREKRGIDDIYLMRVEQLYPVPLKALVAELSRFKKAEVIWCQEEPKNMGAFMMIEPYLEWVLENVGSDSRRPRYAGRPAMAATAAGLMSKHLAQLNQFLEEALAA